MIKGLFIIPGVTIGLIWMVRDVTRAKMVALIGSIMTFIWSLGLWIVYDSSNAGFQLILGNTFGVDGISLWFIILTTFLIPLCILISWESIRIMEREYLTALISILVILMGVFTVLDLLYFYVFYETVLIPMFLVIGIWGGREQKVQAAFYFFFYTLVGSVLMLLAILYIYSVAGTTNYLVVSNWPWSLDVQKWLWLGFFASLAVKIPMVPFHIWLPQAHVEAPVAGSVLLAGVLLKLGGYGFIRFLIPMFPSASEYFAPLVFTLSVIAVIYGSLTTLRQIDVKRLIAYSSVAHMGLVTLGALSLTTEGLEGSIVLMLAHGIVSSGLFIIVTILYDRHHTRIIKYYRGITQTMPIYSIFFFIFTLANIAAPLSCNFIGEFLVLLGTYERSVMMAVLGSIGMILSAGYSLFFYNRIAFGTVSPYIKESKENRDVTRREFMVILPLIVMTIIIGVYPEFILETIHGSTYKIII